MSKRNFVCFDCRLAVRREADSDDSVRCPKCRQPCQDIGYKIPVPPKSEPGAWKTLREEYWRTQRQEFERRAAEKVQRKHELERQIAELAARPENEGRAKEISRLRRLLERLES
jgi:hypothetical protein